MFKNLALLLTVCAIIAMAAALGYGPYRMYYGPNTLHPEGDAAWKLHYLRNNAAGPSAFEYHLYDSHPTRGWTPVPNYRGAGVEHSNNRGHRSPVDYVYQPDKYTVVIVGDSFTWGATRPENEVWPTILQAKDDRLHVVNLAVGGYGVDQMYVTLKEEIAEYKPQLVIVAAIDDDYRRALLSFRDYDKPRFVLDEQGALVLSDGPILGRVETLRQLQADYPLWSGWWRLRAENEAVLKRLADRSMENERDLLGVALLREMVRIARAHNSEVMLLHVATIQEGDSPDMTSLGERLQAEAAAAEGCLAVRTHDRFKNAGRKWVNGHYTLAEAEFLTGIVYESLDHIKSWRHYKAAHPKP